jgi:hypothetical protein
MKIRLLGQRNQLGVGVLFAGFADALKRLFWIQKNIEEIDLTQPESWSEAARSSQPADINIWLSPPAAGQPFKGTQVMWAIFESDRLPPSYLSHVHQLVDLVWTPSAWGKNVLIDNGVDPGKIDVVPWGIDASLFHPYLRERSNAKTVPFRFLMLGKFEERKGYRQLLAGFKKAYGNSDEVVLVIKGDYFLNHQEKMDELSGLIASFDLKNVKLFWGKWNTESLIALYNYAHAFVFPSRAEAWGFPLLEAIATGLPVVTTYYSGQTEFLEPLADAVLKIDHAIEPIRDPEFMKLWPYEAGEYGSWADPNADSIAQNLIELRENYEEYARRAVDASEIVRQRFDWSNSASQACRSLLNRDLLRTGAQATERE